jgi:hypothetical protein
VSPDGRFIFLDLRPYRERLGLSDADPAPVLDRPARHRAAGRGAVNQGERPFAEEHPFAEEVLEAVVETALEHADGGDGGTPSHARSRAAHLVTLVGLVLGGLAVGFVIRRLVQDWAEVSEQIRGAMAAGSPSPGCAPSPA